MSIENYSEQNGRGFIPFFLSLRGSSLYLLANDGGDACLSHSKMLAKGNILRHRGGCDVFKYLDRTQLDLIHNLYRIVRCGGVTAPASSGKI